MADGTRRIVGGKGNKRGTPQGGVASPLLANIYMNRFLKHWRLTGRGEAFRAHVVAYADDFVILSRGRAAEALAWTKAVMTQARAHPQRGQDLAEGCPAGALRLPWLLVRTSLVQGERQVVSGREPVQEEHATVQDEGRRPAGARQQRSVAGSARRAEQVSARLVELLLLRDAAAGIPQQSTTTSMSACATSSPDGTRWQGAATDRFSCRSCLRRTRPAASRTPAPDMPRRGPCGEASRRAGCRRSARPVR